MSVSPLTYTTTEAEIAYWGISSKQEYEEYHGGEYQRAKKSEKYDGDYQ